MKRHRLLPLCALLGFLFAGFLPNLEAQEVLAVGPRDIIFLIDSTMGATLINSVREFIKRFVNIMPIGPDGVQVGVAQFSNIPRLEMDLNSYGSREELTAALGSIKPRPGQTVNIGAALDFVRTNMLRPEKGSRIQQRVPQVLLLMTSKKSSDSVEAPAIALQQLGVLTLAAGSKTATENELQQIAFDDTVAFYLKDFRSLLHYPKAIVDALSTIAGVVVTGGPTEPVMEITTVQTQKVVRDIVFLVDGSNYVGSSNFPYVRAFILNVVNQLDVRPDRVRIGLLQFAESQNIEFHLNSYSSRQDVVNKISQLRLTGGSVLNTGAAMNYALANMFQPSTGSRRKQGVQQVLVLITGGPVQDQAKNAADKLALAGVLTFTVSSGQADEALMRTVAFVEDLAYHETSFSNLPALAEQIMPKLITVVGDTDVTETTFPEETAVVAGAERDVAFLIDGTENVRRDFAYIRDFILKVIEPLDIGTDRVRVSVVQHSERPTPTFYLNTYQTKDEVIRAVRGMTLAGGRSLNTGAALSFMKDTILSERHGSRASQNVPQFLIVLAAGRSRDSVKDSAGALKTEGVVPFGVGVKDADPKQIAAISHNPSFAFNVREFSELSTVTQRLNNYVSLPREELTTVLQQAETQGPRKDVVFLVDGSNGVGREFPIIQEFIRRVVESLNVGENKIRIGVVQYGDSAQADMFLNTHTTKEGVLNAVKGIRQRGGRQRNLGQALQFVSQDVLTAARGGRKQEGVPQFVIVVSSGSSTDDISSAASSLKQSRVLPFSIGTRDVNPTELRVVSYVPNFAFTVDDLPGLYTVQENLINTLTELSDDDITRMRPVFPTIDVITPATTGGEKRDVVFLVDGTTAGREFFSIREMIRRVVEKLDVGLDKVRISVVQYSDDPKLEFLLNEFSTKDEIRQAVMKLQSKGGNRLNTGRALEWVYRNVYQRSAGSRIEDGVPQFLILVTGGKSADDVSTAADQLKRNQVAPLAIGSRNADTDELKQISLKPELVYTVDSFQQLPRVESQLIDSVKTISTSDIISSYVPPSVDLGNLNLGRKDIIFLIDGSDSTGAKGIVHIRDFILNIVRQLDVQPDQVRVGVVQYADRVKTEFSLNSHNNKQAVVSAIQRLRQIGGRASHLADAIDYVIKNEFKPAAGVRQAEASQHLVVLTGGHSPQDVSIYGPLLKGTRVNCIGVGAAGADKRQLTQIATTSADVLQVPDFHGLPAVRQGVIERLSGIIEEPPTDFEDPTSGLPAPKKADIVFLVDGSINLGRDNFNEVMLFITNLIDLFFNERDNLRIGLAHYTADVTDVFYLNTYKNKQDIVSAIGRTEYKGGRRINTGAAIRHVQDVHFTKEKGSRMDEGTPQILMVLTGGRSADDGKTAALGLKKKGVRVFAVGVGDIENELEDLASESSTVARASTFLGLSELNEQILETLDDEVKGKLCAIVQETPKTCSIEVLVGFDVAAQNIFSAQTNLQKNMEAILKRIPKLAAISCSSGQIPSVQMGMLAMDSASEPVQLDFTDNAGELIGAFKALGSRGPFVLNGKTISAYTNRFKTRHEDVVKIVVHLTDGIDAPYAEMKRRVEELRLSGVNSFILVGLERVSQFDEALLLEFGRGFRYTRPLRLNIMDLDYELMEELDNIAERVCCAVPCKCTGTRGDRGAVGLSGPKGSPGGPGSQGHPGDEGGPGERGPPGVNGTQGFQGCPGQRGVKGSRGYSGEKGESGEIGLDGINGEEGKSGVAGPPGDRGNPGKRGPKGSKGQAGDIGEIGIRGDPGTSGRDNNIPGPKGDPGDAGPPGEPGEDGNKGGPGEVGRKGANGRRGPPGQAGIPGKPGEGGVQGEPGIGGSRGPAGPIGVPGPRGEDGNPGPRGPGGSSGPAGEKGRRGALGRKGEPGEPGPKGAIGPLGPRGEPGEDGRDGFGVTGPKGRKGDEGFPGFPGPKGEAGGPGTKGGPGRRGNHGQRGVSVEINECNSNPCMSGGTCVDKVNGFHCLCPPSTHGPLCLSGTDHCAPQPCVHGECIEQQHGYRCECEAGWVGQHCEQERDECKSSPCQNGGTCLDRHNGYTCQCQPGFKGVNCEKNIDECASGPCLHQGICIDGVNNYACQCSPPFIGKHCEMEQVPCASHPCERGGVCLPSADYTSYTCRCPAGWQGTRCTDDANECRMNPCKNGGRCINTQGSYTCKCQPGYSGHNCQTDIDDCSPNPCLNGGSCVDDVGSFSCDCRPGFEGDRCETEVDECASQPCRNSAICRDYVNSFVCECRQGFDGILCQHNILECTESSCLNNGTCIDSINAFSCRCRPGFYGEFCEFEQNECDSQPCKNGGTCTDGLGNYRCTCPLGYNGQNCQNFVNLCSQVRCYNGGSCSQTSTSWTCHCQMGWTGLYCDVPNMSCRDYAAREGLEVENVCKNAGRCENVGNSHRCRCQPGYMGSYCEEMVDECQSNPCRNGATCKDYHGTYECMCKAGYQGVNCEYDVDECHSRPCLHGGTCINLINRFTCACPPGTHGLQCEVNVDDCAPKPGSSEPRCLNGGQCMDGVGRYTCSCPAGFVGEHCEGDVNECLSGPCHAPGSLDCVQLVNNYQCRCRLGYTGRHCESMVDLCLSKPCHNGAVCSMNMSSVHGYTCSCVPGFTGFNCGEIEHYNCLKLRCQNGGRCVESPGHLYCQCQPGFSGPHCENEQRCPWRCQNGGTCIRDPSNPYQYSCRCPVNFSGRTCENKLLTPRTPTCPYLQCEQHSGDEVCDDQCNNHECQWDGGDCSLNWKKPWDNCTASVPCWDLFKNGVCDKECDNPGCLFDSFECQETPPSCKYDKYCADHFGNGICDQSCYTEACGWDGLDCSADTPAKVVDGTLVIVVRLQPEELLGDLRGFLRSLGALLHTNVQVKLDENKKPMVYAYYGVEEEHGRHLQRRKSKRELDREVIGSVVHLELDNRECSQSSVDCFSSTNEAASFIAAAHIKAELPYPLVSVNSDPTVPPQPPLLMILVGVAVVIILLILVLGMLAAKRKHKHGVLWLPDGFMANKNDKRREPVGQDDFDMKNFKTQDGAMIDGGQSQRWLDDEVQSKKPRTEDKPLLPIAMDGGVDRREWTLQHRKAADISLTPPQADLDSDCLDVNVKGPDGFTPLMLASLRNGGGPDCSLHGEEEEESGGDEPGPSVISDLIAQGASLMAQTDRTGETALHLAARYARADAAKRLLDAGADPNAHDNMGRTPLHAAVAADAQGVFQILIRNRATELDARMNDGTTPLVLAARLAVEGMVEELIHCHADINAVDDHGKSALHWAAAVNNVEATLVLLKNGANRDMQDNKEETPLFLAAREGSFEAAQVLLDHYSNRDITDHLDRLPRDTAQERMHHDIVRLLDQYNLVHSPHNGPNHMGGGGNSSIMCGANGAGFIGMRPGPQGKKSRRGGGGAKVGGVGGGAKELKDMKAKRRKKPAGGEGPGVSAGVGGGSGGGTGGGNANGVKAAGGLPESSVTMSPVDSLESPHSYTGDVSSATSTTATSPPLLSSPTSRPMLPPVSHMLGQQQSWVGMTKHGYSGHMFGLVSHQMGGSHPGMGQHHNQGPMLTPMNVTMSREQLPPIVTFQMMAPGRSQAMLKQPQPGQVQATQSQGQNQNQGHSQQGPGHLRCSQGMMYKMPEQMSMAHGLSHALQHPHTVSHGGIEGQSRPLPSYPPMQSPVDKYPTPPSQHSYTTTSSEGTTPGHSAHPPSEHPYLTPSPESPDPWSSSSPHSNSDWSDVTTSPTPRGNPHHALPSSHHTHIPEQVQLQLQSQQVQQASQQPQHGNMQVFA